MFDINSYRRVQNILLRAIASIEKDACPACGGTMRERNEQKICDNCNQLILTKTICANSKCKNVYRYLSYDVSEEMLMKMRNIEKENFYQHDSLYQYKDIVQMSVESGRIRAICPCCKQ
jgi:hypothetical protein